MRFKQLVVLLTLSVLTMGYVSANEEVEVITFGEETQGYLKEIWEDTTVTIHGGMNGGFGNDGTGLEDQIGATFAAEIAPGIFVTVIPSIGSGGFTFSANASANIVDTDIVDVNLGVGLFVGTDGFSAGPNVELLHGTKGYGIMIIPLSAGLGDAFRIVEIHNGLKRYHSSSPITIGLGEILGARTALDALGLHLPLGFIGVIVEFIHDETTCRKPNAMIGNLGLVTFDYDEDEEMLVGKTKDGTEILSIEAKEVVTPWFYEVIFSTEEEYFSELGYPVADEDRIYIKDGSGYYSCSGDLFSMSGDLLSSHIPPEEESLQPLIQGGPLGDIFGTVDYPSLSNLDFTSTKREGGYKRTFKFK